MAGQKAPRITEIQRYLWGIELKCIWNEIFDNNFILVLESALKDKINSVYCLLITCLDPKLWRSEVIKIKWKTGKKLSKDQ